MKVGLIAPTADLHLFASGKFHLLLSHLLGSPEYVNFYQEQARTGAWLTLDNSAYEVGESAVDIDWLMRESWAIGAKEIVIPDVMHDCQKTLVVAGAAFDRLSQIKNELLERNLQLMVVPHGATIYEWGHCLQSLCMMHRELVAPDRKFCIGVPKDYEEFVGGRSNLIQRFVTPIRSEWRDAYGFTPDVHLLGMNDDLTTLTALAQRFPFIRSVDSVKPFVWALYGERLNMEYQKTPDYPGRPSNYFDLTIPEARYDLVRHNIRIIKSRVGDTE